MKKNNKLHVSLTLGRAALASARSGARILRRLNKRGATHERVDPDVRKWGQSLCDIFNVTVRFEGEELGSEPCILVSNHVSLLDVPVLMSKYPVAFVAKAELKSMPFIGAAAEAFGVIFIDRGSPESRKDTGKALAKAVLEDYHRVMVFPEGTTTMRGLPWRAGVFKIAQENNIPMRTISLCYRPFDKVAYEIDPLLRHAKDICAAGEIDVVVTVGPKFFVTNFVKDCEHWEKWCKTRVSASLKIQGLL